VLIRGQVHIAKLPLELLDLVIGQVFAEEKIKHLLEWSETKKCHDGDCSPIDHFDEDEKDELKREVLYRYWDDIVGAEDEEDEHEVMEDMLTEHVANMHWHDICSDRKIKWSELTAMVCLISTATYFDYDITHRVDLHH
jgi:hypothetical protein